jgi:hypothetical protein
MSGRVKERSPGPPRCPAAVGRGGENLGRTDETASRPAASLAIPQLAPLESAKVQNRDHGDVRVGTIAMKNGAPSDVDQWRRVCGFYPGSHPGEHLAGSAPDFEQARAGFEATLRIFRPSEQRRIIKLGATIATGQRGNKQDIGMKMRTQTPDGTARCLSGATFTITSVWGHVRDLLASRCQPAAT